MVYWSQFGPVNTEIAGVVSSLIIGHICGILAESDHMEEYWNSMSFPRHSGGKGFKMVNDCIFCQIINGKSPAHILWEDENHMAFLSIFPNTPGFSVVVTKEHLPSYVVDLDDVRFANLF